MSSVHLIRAVSSFFIRAGRKNEKEKEKEKAEKERKNALIEVTAHFEHKLYNHSVCSNSNRIIFEATTTCVLPPL